MALAVSWLLWYRAVVGVKPKRRLYPPLPLSRSGSVEPDRTLADEASGPRGAFLPLPIDGTDETIAVLKTDIRKAGGKMLTVEGGDWSVADGNQVKWQQQRFGAEPPDALVELVKLASSEVFSACGVNPALFADNTGTAGREAYRQFLHSTLAPLGRLVEAELSAKLASDVRLDWEELRAGDVAGRARAFQSLVGGGMAIEDAARVSGVLMKN